MNARLACVVFGFASAAPAQVPIVNWGGDYVSAQQLFVSATPGLPPNVGFRSGVLNWQPRQPTSGYSGGAFCATALAVGPTNINLAAVANAAEGDTLSVQIILKKDAAPGPHEISAHLEYHWPQAGFAELPQGAEVRLHGFSIEARCSAPAAGTVLGRWMVQIGERWFLSENTFSPGATFSTQGSAIGEITGWHPYEAEKSLAFAPGPAGALPAGQIHAVGFYVYLDRENASGASHIQRVDVRRFSVTALAP